MNNNKAEQGNSVYALLAADYYERIFQNQENQVFHNPITHEYRLLGAIERGDPEVTKQAIKEGEEFRDLVGTLAEDPLRHEKNLGIVNVTIASRAAIHGGLYYEKAFILSDCCIRRIEKCTDIETVRELYHAAQLQYAELVRDSKLTNEAEDLRKNYHIEQCKNYIFTHLHGKITVQEIASHIGLTPNYLSALFRKYEHVGLNQYIMNEKIKLVQKMLIYSPYSYIEIANYFGFTSQSHMGGAFKKVTGLTLRSYREKYKNNEFFEN